jgi:hypothetical protein
MRSTLSREDRASAGADSVTVPAGMVASRFQAVPLLLLPAAAAVPVLLNAGLVGSDAEAGQLRALAQAALEFGEAGESGQPDDVVHSWAASDAFGSRLITGPKKATPVGGSKWMKTRAPIAA